jgi:hypothetical protein
MLQTQNINPTSYKKYQNGGETSLSYQIIESLKEVKEELNKLKTIL